MEQLPQVLEEIPMENNLTKDKKKKQSVWNKMFNKSKLDKNPRLVMIWFLRNNGNVQILEQEPKKGFFTIEGRTYHEDQDCIWKVGKQGYPLAIIEENTMLPIGTRRWYEKRPQIENDVDFIVRKYSECEDHCLRGIRHAEAVRYGEREPTKINPKAIIWGIIGIALIYALLKGGSVF